MHTTDLNFLCQTFNFHFIDNLLWDQLSIVGIA